MIMKFCMNILIDRRQDTRDENLLNRDSNTLGKYLAYFQKTIMMKIENPFRLVTKIDLQSVQQYVIFGYDIYDVNQHDSTFRNQR